MLLLTGATGLVGSALLRRLVGEGTQVRCLVRDPRRLGAQRVRVQIALGDLTDPPSFRNAMRGVDTVVHLAASIRDQPRGSIEELNGIATWRMVRAAQRQGVERFVFFSVLGASTHHRARFFRAKALAEQAVAEAELRSTVFAPSIVYAPGDPWLTLLERMALLPADARLRARARQIPADLGRGRGRLRDRRAARTRRQDRARRDARSASSWPARRRSATTRSSGSCCARRTATARCCTSRRRSSRAALRLLEATVGQRAFATWDEAELMEVPMLSGGARPTWRAWG